MRTNVHLDDELIADAMKAFGVRTKREAIDIALRDALRLRRQDAIMELWGIGWEGDLDETRIDKALPQY